MSIVSGNCPICGDWGVLYSVDQCWDCFLAQYQAEIRGRRQRRDAVYGGDGSHQHPAATGTDQWEPQRPLSWTPTRTGPSLGAKFLIFLVLVVVVLIAITHLS
jgi:hypothetical protein